MATKVVFKTTFEAAKTLEPIYTGGSVSANGDGKVIATCVEDDVLLVSSTTGKVLCRIDGDGEPVTSLCLARDLSWLVICSRSLSLRIFALSATEDAHGTWAAQLSRTLKPHETPVVSSDIDATASVLATGAADGSVKVWDLRGGYASHTFHGHGGVVSALKFFAVPVDSHGTSSRKRKSRDGASDREPADRHKPTNTLLASGGEDGKIRIWNLSTRKSIAVLDSHVSVVRSLDYTDDRRLLLSASRDRTVILWDAETWKEQKVIPALEVIETAGLLKAGQFCFTGGEFGLVRIWQTGTGRELTPKRKPGLESDTITRIVPVDENATLLSIHQDQTMKFQSVAALEDASTSDVLPALPVIRTMSGNYDEVIDMACVGPQRDLLALATNTEAIKLISIAGHGTTNNAAAAESFGNDVALLEGHDDIIICVDVDWSGHWLATGAKDNTARLWRLDPAAASYTCVASFAGHAESLGAIALPRGAPASGPATSHPAEHPPAFLLTGSQDKTIKRWDTSKLQWTPSLAEPHSGMKALFTRVAHEKDINAIDVSPIAPLFASASQDRTIKIWSLEDGSVTGILRGHKRGVWSIRFSPTGTPPIALPDGGSSGSRGLLVSGSGDRTVKIWSLSTYTCLQTFEGHSNSVLKVIWIPPPAAPPDAEDGESRPPSQQHLIASASSDTLIKLWSPDSAPDSDHLLATLDNHTDRVWALVVPNSYRISTAKSPSRSPPPYPYPLISGAADATLTFWRDTTVQTATQASQRATERIEQDQRLQNYILAKNYREAITLALALNHPGRLLRVFEDVVNVPDADRESSSIMGVQAVDDVLASLDPPHIFALLERVRDWNTNARTATVAQRVLHCLLKSYPADTLVDMAKDRQLGRAGQGMKDLLRALEVYTERHYNRLEELVDESYLIEYTLREMDEVAGVAVGMDGISTNGRAEAHQHDVIMH